MTNSMQYNPLVFKRLATRKIRDGRSSPFRDAFWGRFSDAEAYSSNLSKIKRDLSSIEEYDDNQQVYIAAHVDFETTNESKSATPESIWQLSGLEVVGADTESNFVVSGLKSDFNRLNSLLSGATYEKAKNGQGITKRKQNAYRETFALSGLFDISKNVSKRVDNKLKVYIENSSTEPIDCIIELRSDIKLKHTEIKVQLEEKIGSQVIPAKDAYVIHNMFYYVQISPMLASEILSDENYSYIQIIRAKEEFSAQRLIPSTSFNGMKLTAPTTDEVVGIIDSGVNEPFLEPLCFDTMKVIPHHRIDDKVHGTFVTSRVLFGDKIFAQFTVKTLSPLCKYLDIQVLYSHTDGTECDESLLMDAIDTAFRKYESVILYNISINSKSGIMHDDFGKEIHPIVEFIDVKAREFDKLPIISSGNQNWYESFDYEDIFEQDNSDIFIASPSDALNALTVGSVTNVGSDEFICPNINSPSPFSRRGGIRGGLKKPELCHYGGNILKPKGLLFSDNNYIVANRNKAGVEGIVPGGLAKDIGTSFSTPLVTRESVIALSNIRKYVETDLLNVSGNYANLVKACLIHSTLLTEPLTPGTDSQKECLGFGIPNAQEVFNGTQDRTTVIYCDAITLKEKKHSIVFKLPDFLIGSKINFKQTVVYNPPVNKNFPSQYNQIYIKSSAGFLRPKIDDEGNPTYARSYISGDWGWDNYSNTQFNVMQFSSVKKVVSPFIEVLIQATATLEFEKEMASHLDEVDQKYSVLITIEDLSNSNRLREELILTNQFNQLEVEEQVEVTQ